MKFTVSGPANKLFKIIPDDFFIQTMHEPTDIHKAFYKTWRYTKSISAEPIMRIFKNKAFNKWATKEGLDSDALRFSVNEMECGLIDVDLS